MQPRISIIMPVYNPELSEFKQTIDSLLWQAYPNWELCIADDSSRSKDFLKILREAGDKRIKTSSNNSHSGIAGASQSALEMATGEYVAFMDQDDELYPDALYSFIKTLQSQDIDYFYSDRDIISPQGKRYMHFLKPGWSPEYLLSFNYLRHLEIYSKSVLTDVGGIRKEYEGSQDYDLALRVTEQTDKVVHYPMVLYSWRQSDKSIASDTEKKLFVYESGVRALNDAAQRRSLPVKEVKESTGLWRGHYRIIWDRDTLNKGRIYLISVTQNATDGDRIRNIFRRNTDIQDAEIISTDDRVGSVKGIVKKLPPDSIIFFCDDSVEAVVEDGFIDMTGFLSIEGVGAVGCKFLDLSDKIFNTGLSVTESGRILYNYRGSHCSEHGYGAGASVPRNTSLVFPAFWGSRASTLNEYDCFSGSGSFYHASMNFFLELIKSDRRIVCVPYMCLRIDNDRLPYHDDIKASTDRWIKEGLKDKYYNPNLTDTNEDFGINV